MEKYDFSGWATKANIKCSDGRVIMKDAFKHNDGQIVPLVWGHQHDDPLRVLGHALLENREEGVYAYGKFNDTESGRSAKILVEHGDVVSLSIYANQLKQQGPNVNHGAIREVSLVLAGANPGAKIDSVLSHGDDGCEEGVIFSGEEDLQIFHAEEKKEEAEETKTESETDTENKKGKTIQDALDSMDEDQRIAMYAVIGTIVDGIENKNDENVKHNDDSEGGNETMKTNVFDQETVQENNVISHSDMMAVINDAKRFGSMKESALQHGITDIEYLFPDYKSTNTTPDFISRDMGWVKKVMNGVHHTPFSRIKSTHANITADEARAKGYMKGGLKKEEVFALLKRTTDPQTIYKKQKLDRDDIVDITDFDVVAWLKGEMRMMLDEEIARAILVGDGRLADSEDKIKPEHIRPVWTDDDLYAVKALLEVESAASDSDKAKAFIRAAIKNRKNYKGSGEPTLYCSEDVLTECLLLEDNNGRVIYDSVSKLATALRVKEIVTVEPMTGLVREKSGKNYALMGIIVNLNDYNVGADKGGAVNMFDDFDIDYNAQKYLIETRISGALTKPHSALILEIETA